MTQGASEQVSGLSRETIRTAMTGLLTYEGSIKKAMEQCKPGSLTMEWLGKLLVEIYQARNELSAVTENLQ